jgi:hypothetical protein
MKNPWIVVIAAVLIGFAGGWLGRPVADRPESGVRSAAEQARLIEEAREKVRQEFEVERAANAQRLQELQPVFEHIERMEPRANESEAEYNRRMLESAKDMIQQPPASR